MRIVRGNCSLTILTQALPQAPDRGVGERESVDAYHCRCRYGLLSQPLPFRSKSSLTLSKMLLLTTSTDRDCGLRSCSVRRLLGGDPVVGPLATSSAVQLAEAGRDLVLQHGPYPSRVVEHVGNPGRALQPGKQHIYMESWWLSYQAS